MKAFLTRAMSSRYQAIAWTGLSACVALLLAPLSLLMGLHCVSSALVGLAVLRNGAAEGATVLVGGAALGALMTWLLIGSPIPALMLALMVWVPTAAMCLGVRALGSPGWVLAVAGLCAMAGCLVFRWHVGDPGQWWMSAWRTMLEGASTSPEQTELAPALLSVMEVWAPVTTALVACGFLVLVTLTTLGARWGHAVLDNPGGFGREFRALSMPRGLGWLTAGIVAVTFVGQGGWREAAMELALIAATVHAVQGLAVVHAVVAKRKLAKGWLVLMYVMLLVMPLSSLVALALATTGFSDGWARYRERVGVKS